MKALPWWGKPLLVAALAGAALYGADQFGYRRAANLYAGKLATAEAGHARQLLRLAEQRLTEQAAAEAAYRRLNEQAHQVGWALLQTRRQLEVTQRQLKQRIPDATRTDGPRFTGLGPDSLRLYRQFLGYPASGEADLPAADAGHAGEAAAAAGTEAGLSPADLLEHAADYGQWCQQLDAQLSAYLRLHAATEPEVRP
ncbi:hypothetical protein [Crenobacter luteus]|uniref:Uncharacterized protein n=1 Tax=Crenobacter luteus TaxID=1452487 RepID=A0A163D926_9NEIS|nr:hypothetical protein [Crenobacter luteus]KZE34166.1 hypothetical protein AVW16_06735 [Crenobacter luteus]